jgi:NAD(P)-dependent dehydrogenase (short-subunit alcohol dehydrogenase family)
VIQQLHSPAGSAGTAEPTPQAAEKRQQERPPQKQEHRPGRESQMTPKPISRKAEYKPAGKLMGKAALITGGDSGIGRAVAVMFAQEGADVAIIYLNEHDDAEETKRMVESHGRKCLTIAGDVGDENFCRSAIERTVSELGGLDVLVNNAGEQHPQGSIEDITAEQLERTFRTNVFAYFFMAKHALPHLKEGSAVINTASVQAYKGNPTMLDYGATKGAEVTFTRALSKQLIEKGIRVNAVAPGPVWTPLIPSTMPEKTENFGEQTPMGRAGEPAEIAPCYVFLACDDSCYMSGQVLHPNGGDVIGG